MNKNIFKYIGVAFNEINSLSCMYYANCNSSALGYYYSPPTSLCMQNMYSRSPSLVSRECSFASAKFCFTIYLSYTNYLTNSLLGYLSDLGCYYNQNHIRPTNLSTNLYDFYSNLSSTLNKPILKGEKYIFCNTSNCNSQAGACFSAELVQDVFSSNLTSVGNLTSLPIYQSCSTGSNSSLPTFKLTIAIGLRVNQVFISDYNNLNSAASLSFIQNFTKFVNYYYLF